MSRRAALKVNLVLAILAIAASIYLTYVHYQSTGGSTHRSMCTVSAQVNCDLVTTSEYSTLFAIPISILGGLFYAFLLVLAALGIVKGGKPRAGSAPDESRERAEAGLLLYSSLLSFGAVGYSVFLFYVSHYILQTWCIFCSALWTLNLLLFLSSTLALRLGPAAVASHIAGDMRGLAARPLRLAVAIVVVLLCTGGFGHQAIRYTRARKAALVRVLAEFDSESPIEASLSSEQPAKGGSEAPHTLVEWLDFRCGHCRRAAALTQSLLREFPGKLKIIAAQLPLDPTCNPLIPASSRFHLHSCEAAEAALCAQEQGKYWEFEEELFLDPNVIGPERIQAIARDLGLDLAAFRACLGSERVRARLKGDIESGARVLEGLARPDSEGRRRVSLRTPILLLDGKEVPGIPPLAFWRKVLG